MRRKSLSRGYSRRSFTRGAMRVHSMNLRPVPQRGGLRL